MSAKPVSLNEIRRFVRLRRGETPMADPEWVADFTARVRYDVESARRARQAYALMLPLSYHNPDPTRQLDDCLPADQMAEIEESAEQDTPRAKHFHGCASCQFRYQEALALSEIYARKLGTVETDTEEEPDVFQPILVISLKIAASYAAIMLTSPELMSGLLDTERATEASEVVIRPEGNLAGARLRLDDEARRLSVSQLPPWCAPSQLRLRAADQMLKPMRTERSEAVFDLDPIWHVTDSEEMELVVAAR